MSGNHGAQGTTTRLAGDAAREPSGDGPTRAELFERVFERIYRYFRKTVWDADAADDCTQRTLVELERSLREGLYEPGRSFNTWIWMKAHKVFVAHCRERGRALEALDDAALAARAAAPIDPPQAVDERLDAAAVLRAVADRLGPEAHECFVLRYEGELTLDAIAVTVGRDRKTVAARIRAAHALIERLLGDSSRGGAP
jgi:RNA polymerase sigma factor (sigma-70 family)